jgi:pimeloyl-ACP methyl ester carboxylesterase
MPVRFVCVCILLLCPVLAAQELSAEGFIETAPGVRVFYQRFGAGKPKKLIVPGRLFVVEQFKALAKDLDIVLYDMRNRGKSSYVEDGATLTLENDVRDLEAVRRHFGFEKTSVSGYSYLGKVVILYAMEHPQRVERIVQVGPVPMKFGTTYAKEHVAFAPPEIEAKRAELAAARKNNEHIEKPLEFCEKQWEVSRLTLVGNPANAPKLGASKCDLENERAPRLDRHMQHAFVGSAMNHTVPWEQVTAAVTHPVLTVHGTLDRNAPYGAGREWAERLPNARLLTVKNAAHQVFAEYPEIFLPAVRTFLKGGWPKGAESLRAGAKP